MFRLTPVVVFAIIVSISEIGLFGVYLNNLLVFARSETLFSLLWLNDPFATGFDGFFGTLPCSDGLSYLFCGLEQQLFFWGYLGIPLGGILSLSISRLSSKKPTQTVSKTVLVTVLLLITHALTAAAALATAGVILFHQADQLISRTVSQLADSPEYERDPAAASAAIQSVPHDQSIHVREAVFAVAHAAALHQNEADPRPLNQTKDTFFRTFVLPVAIDMRGQQLLAALPDMAWTQQHQRLFVFDAPLSLIQELAPTVSEHLLRSRFGKHIDARPATITVSENLEYVVYQQQRIRAMYQDYEDQIATLESELAEVDAYLAENSRFRAGIPSSAPNADAVRQLVDQYSQEARLYQQQLRLALDATRQQYQLLKENPVTPELQGGVYFYPDQIYIRYFNDESNIRAQTFSKYLYVILHEQLHLYSTGAGGFETYLEEGMTDYLAYTTLVEALEYQQLLDLSYTGYPYEISLVQAMMAKIPPEEMTEIYFAEDGAAYEQAFHQAFPEVPFDQFNARAIQLSYTPLDQRQVRQSLHDELVGMLGVSEEESLTIR